MLFFRKVTALSAIAVVGFTLGTACSSDSEDPGVSPGSGATSSGATSNSSGGTISFGGDGSGNGTSAGGDSSSVGGATGTGAGPTITPDGEVFCGDVACQCSDGIDNDGDGDEDGFDVECQGPLDNDEGSFATGIPGDNKDESWVDCFFDGDSGSGNDGCKYPYECLTGDIPIDDEQCAGAASEACINFCGPRTPNGCDCFGCCTIDLEDGSSVDILTASGCDLDDIDNEDVCLRCVKTDTCENTCGECELCPGKTEEDLPEDCMPDPPVGGAPSDPPPVYTCEGGEVCGDNLPCDAGYYCSLGCCIPVVK